MKHLIAVGALAALAACTPANRIADAPTATARPARTAAPHPAATPQISFKDYDSEGCSLDTRSGLGAAPDGKGGLYVAAPCADNMYAGIRVYHIRASQLPR